MTTAVCPKMTYYHAPRTSPQRSRPECPLMGLCGRINQFASVSAEALAQFARCQPTVSLITPLAEASMAAARDRVMVARSTSRYLWLLEPRELNWWHIAKNATSLHRTKGRIQPVN